MTQTKTQQLSPQIFAIWSDEVKGRINPYFYKPWKYNFRGVLLNSFIEKIGSGSYISRDKIISNGIPYLRVQNLKANDIEIGKLFLQKNEQVAKTNAKTFLTGRVGSLGIFRMAKGEYFYSDNILSIEFKDDQNINLEYLETVLNSDLVKEQIERNCKGNNQKLISQETIRNLKIPLPSLSIQNKIVEIMQKAYQEKKEKKAGADKLLESIDGYVLDELGIKTPEIKREMVFEVMSDDTGNRIDSKYYQKFYKLFIEEIKKCKFQKEPLKNITEFIMNGRTPDKDDYVNDEENGIPLIKAGTASGKLVNMEKLGYVKNEFKGKQTVAKGDIFILSAAHQAEYVGKNVSLLDDEPSRDTYFVGELLGIRANPDKCLSEYLFGFLSSQFAFTLINREKRGQTSHLYPNDLKNLLIPLPPLSVQKKIADRLESYRNQAQNLQNEVKENLQKAKDKVEGIILS